jgi:hypothetical protein
MHNKSVLIQDVFFPNKDWELHQDVDGNVMEVDELKNKIFRGGIEHSIRFESTLFDKS